MIDSEIINGQLTGVIEPNSRAHQVLRVVAGLLIMKKLTRSDHRLPLRVSDQELREQIRNSGLSVHANELRVLINYGLIIRDDRTWEPYEETRIRMELGLEREYPVGTVLWSLGEYTTEVLNFLKDGDEAHVYL